MQNFQFRNGSDSYSLINSFIEQISCDRETTLDLAQMNVSIASEIWIRERSTLLRVVS